MSVDPDPSPRFAGYAAPDRLVSTDWLSAHLGDPAVRIVESSDDAPLYDVGHIPGALKIDGYQDLSDPVNRDYLDGERFARLMRRKGIRREHTVVLYGDKSNRSAAATLWVFALFGHPDVRLLDGGRDAWLTEDREVSFDVPEPEPVDYPVVTRDDTTIRAFRDDVLTQLGHGPLVDVRAWPEYTGERTHPPDHPAAEASRGGHIPTAENIPWARAVGPDGRFRPVAQLRETYGHLAESPVVTYCRIGAESSHTWFVLTHLLGHPEVRNYDGSWTEWGNTVRAPIVRGDRPGRAP